MGGAGSSGDLTNRHFTKEEEEKSRERVMIMAIGLAARFGHLMYSVDNLLVR